MFGVPKGSYAVEYSLKSGPLRRTVVDAPERAYELLAGWAFDRPGWKQSAKWEHVTNDDVVDFQAGCTWLDEDGVLVVEFQPLGLRASGTNREEAMATLMLQLSDATQDKETALAFSGWCADHVVKSSELLRIRRSRETARVKGAISKGR